jgi:ABC-2 type transport system ATP-binding protein
MGDALVKAEGLRKVYQRKKPTPEVEGWQRWLPRRGATESLVAVEEVSFEIQHGEIFGLLGPNGAGKTTTIKMLSTLLEPTAGTATIAGYDIVRQPNKVRQHMGAVLTGERSIYWKLTGRENLEYFAALYHLPPAVARKRVDELLQRLDLIKRADDLVERYSSGMKQRVALAKALLAKPPVLLLDEPTIGLDPQSARNLRELILEIQETGTTVLLTTHYMEEADLLCQRIAIVDHGQIIALDTPQALKRSINQLDVMQVEVEAYDPALEPALQSLPAIQTVAVQHNGPDSAAAVTVHTHDSRTLLPVLIHTIAAKTGQIRHMQVTQPTLEDVFIALTGKQLRE